MRGVHKKSSRGDFKLLLVVLAAAVTLGWLTAAFSHLNKVHGEEQVVYSHEQHGSEDTLVAEDEVPERTPQRSSNGPKSDGGGGGGGGAPKGCKADWKPYHVLLTAQSGPYQDWQSRIMYYHFKKQQRLNPCTEMVNFTRLVATATGAPDGLEDEMPSIFMQQMDPQELARKYGSFAVLNRPHTMVMLVNNPALMARFAEDYIFIAETDHVLFQDIPNLATETMPAGYKFGYMQPNQGFDRIIKRVWPQGGWDKHDQTGPSPLIIHKEQLKAVAQPWLDFSLALKTDSEANAVLGWVLEMWGYVLAAGSLGIKHTVLPNFQIEPANLNQLKPDFWKQYYIYHYTYGIEYTMDGKPMMNTIGEWSLDKRHYGASYPPRNLRLPPKQNTAAGNAAAVWLVNAFNEATAGIPTWPTFPTLGTIGWRRECITREQLAASPIAQMVATSGVEWAWAGVKGMRFKPDGVLVTPWGEGKWGAREDDFNCPEPHDRCLYADFANSNHNLYFPLGDQGFTSKRIGDGEVVQGTRIR